MFRTHFFHGRFSFNWLKSYWLIAWGIISLLLFLHSNFLSAQSSALSGMTGTPFIRNFAPDEYGAHNQNWAIVQDHRGFIYSGNNHGVIEYDGVSWRTIPTDGNNIIRSLAADKNGVVYIGSFGEIGYLAPDSLRQLDFVSLMPHVDTAYHNFSDVWQTIATSDGVFFVTPQYILRWNGNNVHVWIAETSFHMGYEVNDQFYIRQKSKGLMQINGDDLVFAPLGERFAEERIMAIMPFPSRGTNAMLLTTRSNGLLIYDGISVTKFSSEADALLEENQVYCATKLLSNQYAFGTLQTGIVIIDDKGRLLHHINKNSGLQDETIWYLYPDTQGSLWAGMHYGISRIEAGSPHTYYGEREGLEGSVLHLLRHRGTLYAATSMGIYYLDERNRTSPSSGKFQRVEHVAPQGWALLGFNNSVIAGTFEGVYEINGSTGRVIDSVYAMSFARSLVDTNRVFIGLHEGFKSIYYRNGTWHDEGYAEGLDHEILGIHPLPDGSCWLTTRYSSLFKLDYSGGFSTNPVITMYDTLHGLPDGDRTIAFNTTGGIRFGTSQGVYLFDEAQQKFIQDTTLIKGLNDLTDIFSVTSDPQGNLWMIVANGSGVAWLQSDNTYQWDNKPLLRLDDIDDYYAYPDPFNQGITWIGSIDRVVRYDRHVKSLSDQPFQTYIRRISINEDSLLYGGADLSAGHKFILHPGDRSIRFSFAAPFFDKASQTEYQYMLEGYDEGWSAWSTETYKDYTGLSSGDYHFRVRARNIYGITGETATVDFRIMPPFYLNSVAFLIYALLLIGMIYALWKFQLKRIQRTHSRELKELEYVKLKELDQLKSRFFADISHEFRTPLTLILGPVENLLATNPPQEETRQYQLIRRNAQRLLRLINQLLDLSKLDAGKMKLDLGRKDIMPLFRGIVPSFESLAESKNVQLSLESNLDAAIVDYDQDKMEQVVSNLISNAIKFTPEGGGVKVSVSQVTGDDLLEIQVTDTGSGIPSHQLPFVFDRFYQGDEAMRIDEPGTGIGLALAKELIELHKGQIGVRSKENEGSTFTILLPFKADEVSDRIHSDGNESSKTYLPFEQGIDRQKNDEDLGGQTFENTILLVEDNPDMRAFIRETLTGHYRVLQAVDGADGVAKALETIPDIIISDVMMPKMDGLELCRTLKSDERTSHIPVILLTAKADIESKLEGLKRGADDYLAKPFHKEELLVRTENLLDLRKRLWDRYTALPAAVARELPAQEVSEDIQIEDAFLQKIRVLIEDNLSDAEFEIDTLSRLAAMSRSQLFRKVKALTGKSPSLFIRNIRLSKAKELLENTGMNVTEVAYQVGFSTPAYFSDAFTETYGIRPSSVKK